MNPKAVIIVSCVITSCLPVSSPGTCKNYAFSSNQAFESCIDLPVLDAYLHRNYLSYSNMVEIAYRASQTRDGWVAWGINPTDTGMMGSQVLVAFHNSTDGKLIVYSTPIEDYNPSMQPGPLSFGVLDLSAEHLNNEMIIYALVGPFRKATVVNHVWQAGDAVSDNVPQMHQVSGPNLESMGMLDFLSA